MPILDKRLDDYIDKSAEYKGPLCSMASFKQHCAFGFWKSKLLHDPEGHLSERYNQGGKVRNWKYVRKAISNP